MKEFEFRIEMHSSDETGTDDESTSSTISEFDPSSRLMKEFNILGHIGSGAFANVYQVRNKLDNSLYAIKRIKLNLNKNEQMDKKITKEVELLSKLNHQNIVRYYNSWIEDFESPSENNSVCQPNDSIEYDVDEEIENDDSNSIVFQHSELKSENMSSFMNNSISYTYMCIQMEYCEQSTLRNAIDDNLFQDQDRVGRLMEQSVGGLAYIHDKGIIHRDLKPDNVFIDGNGRVKIGDFGLATLNNALQGDSKSSHTGEVGTPLYDAPELKSSGPKVRYDQKIDMYSLGVIFFEMCCPPFSTTMERKEVLSRLRNIPLKIPLYKPKNRGSSSQESYCPNERQIKLIEELLDHDPEKRPNATEILKNGYLVLDRYLQSFTSTIIPNAPLERKISTSRLTYLEDFDIHDDDVRKANFLEMLIDKAREIFRLHGGIYSPSCLPSDSIEGPAPYDFTHSFANYLVDNPRITHMKRYTFNELSHESYFIKSSTPFKCARFDIVSPISTNLIAMETEVLLIVCEFLERFSGRIQMNDFVIRLNHSKMVPKILQYLRDKCGFKRDYKGCLVNPEMSCMNYALKEYASLTCIHDITIEDWELIQKGQVERDSSLFSHVFHLRHRAWRSNRFYRESFDELKYLADLIKSLDIKCPIVIAPSLMRNYQYSNIMFQVTRKDSIPYGGSKSGVVAAGGRYDKLIAKCKRNSEMKRHARQSAVGLTIYFDQFIDFLKPETKLLKFEVLVCSDNSSKLLKEKLKLAKELWAAEIRTTISYVEHKSLEETEGYCKEMKIPYILFLEETKEAAPCKVVLCSLTRDRFQKKEFTLLEVVHHLRKTIKGN